MNVAHMLQGLSYKVCSTTSPNYYRIWVIYSSFWNATIIQQQPAAMLRGHMRSCESAAKIYTGKHNNDQVLFPNFNGTVYSFVCNIIDDYAKYGGPGEV